MSNCSLFCLILFITPILAAPVDEKKDEFLKSGEFYFYLSKRINFINYEIIVDCTKPIHHPGRPSCFAAIPVYTWNSSEKLCKKGIYGGCNGSKNQFSTLEKCQQIAGKVCI